jgi:hypothetical protein
MPSAEGRFDPITGVVSLPRSTVESAKIGDPRANFTIAHEIGHIADGVTETRNRGSVKGKRTARDENFANRFAAGFLAPFHRAKFGPTTTVESVRQHFNLSHATAKIRHDQFSRWYRKVNRTERPLPATVVSFLEEARAKGKAVKSLPQPDKRAVPGSGENRIPPSPPVRDRTSSGEVCSVCASDRLELIGSTKAYCRDCRATYVRFQDGDPASQN